MMPAFFTQLLEKEYPGEQIRFPETRKTTLRVNTLRSTREEVVSALDGAGIAHEDIAFSSIAFLLPDASARDVTALPLFNEGKIYLQSLSAMLPPLVLDPQKGDDLLDMAAAPGGKTTQMAAMTDNKASITACERHPIRAEKLKHNLQLQGVSCANVMVTDARQLDDFFSFSRVLLDAPCSGSGTVLENDPSVEKTLTPVLVKKCRAAQVALLKKGLKVLKPGGTLVYSTCSILREENEDVVRECLKGVKAHIAPIELSGLDGLPTLPVTLPGTLCVKPTEEYEGFYVAKIVKDR